MPVAKFCSYFAIEVEIFKGKEEEGMKYVQKLKFIDFDDDREVLMNTEEKKFNIAN